MFKTVKSILCFIVIFLSLSIAKADECDFSGFSVGDNTTELKEVFGYLETESFEKKNSLPSIQVDFEDICPERGLKDAEVHILVFDEKEIAGFYIESYAFIEEGKEMDLLFNYVKSNFPNSFKIKDPNWNGNADWKRLGKEYYYTKEADETLIKEELLITSAKYEKFISDVNDAENLD